MLTTTTTTTTTARPKPRAPPTEGVASAKLKSSLYRKKRRWNYAKYAAAYKYKWPVRNGQAHAPKLARLREQPALDHDEREEAQRNADDDQVHRKVGDAQGELGTEDRALRINGPPHGE